MGNHVCPWWYAYTFDNPLRRLIHKPEKIFHRYVRPGMIVADIGCGMGYFSIAFAKMVGDGGLVISVDLQQKMLEILEKRARKNGVAHRIQTHRCDANDLGIQERVDFVLAFWMVHETPDEVTFFQQVFHLLKGTGSFVVAEPKMHVTESRFSNSVSHALASGFRIIERPRIHFSHSIAFGKAVLDR